MRISLALFLCGFVALMGCGGGDGITRKPFLDEKQTVAAKSVWSREMASRSNAKITFKITAPGPLNIRLVTANGHRAWSAKAPSLEPADVLLTTTTKSGTYNGEITLPAGSTHFIIENLAAEPTEVHLQCTAD